MFLFLSSVLESGASYQKISVLSKLEKLGENRGIVEKVFYFSGDVRLVKLFRKMDSLHYAIFMIFLGQNKGFVRLSEDDVMGLILKFGAGTILRDVISENS